MAGLSSPAYRIRQGETIVVGAIASVVVALVGSFRVLYDNGKDDDFTILGTTVDTRIVEGFRTAKVASDDGYIIEGHVQFDGTADQSKRGQCFINVNLQSPGSPAKTVLCRGYLHEFHSVILGQYEANGPDGGEGFLSWVSLAADIAPVDITRTLALANTIRKVYGFVWYYNCAVVAATRTMDASMRNLGLAFPTGFAGAANADNWRASTITLTTGEEGTMTVIGNRHVSNDTNVLTIQNTAGAPTPFPYTATEDDLAAILFDVGAAEATDRHSLYLLQEEWLVL